MQSTFTEFKNSFYSRVPDLSLFDCGDINLLKVVLDGLKVNYIKKGKIRSFLFYNEFIFYLFCFIKRRRNNSVVRAAHYISKLKKLNDREIIINEAGRFITDNKGNTKSVYFESSISKFGRDNVFIAVDNHHGRNFDNDLHIKEVESALHFLPLSNIEKQLRKNIIGFIEKLRASNKFSIDELRNIKFACHNFFFQFKVWNEILNVLPRLKKCLFICHYHKEGQILSLKQHQIECVELQHGLIASQDIFYVFPKEVLKIKKKALFADKILVYGNYWKQVLLKGVEYSDDQIKIGGYYLYEDFNSNATQISELKNLIGNKQVILITTQTFLHEYFINLAKRLSLELHEAFPNLLILIKPHPIEKTEIYKDALSDYKNIQVVEYPISVLFILIKFNISVYSTTLYDALRYGVKNYVFKVPGCEDYVDEILKEGIAEEITVESLGTIDFFDNKDSKVDFSRYYGTCNLQIF